MNLLDDPPECGLHRITGRVGFRVFAPRGSLAIRTADANETLLVWRASGHRAELVAKSVLTNCYFAERDRHGASGMT
jgi:hypothetical protein